ncbi:hypothetical protein [Moorena sp. SIO2C4]|uniref:hypothetical protein n=1 Tax=Moorena sp. SIO2C4 TaxID=2607824 RepID=UPI0013C69CFC|nr:hypothetical protein [Moorena sp. SIO2C4]NES44385.1 hypothetical protein [Moorena sp. SIO2C4]
MKQARCLFRLVARVGTDRREMKQARCLFHQQAHSTHRVKQNPPNSIRGSSLW